MHPPKWVYRFGKLLTVAFIFVLTQQQPRLDWSFDISYARVYKGSQNSGWHGTSVQAVQPLPSLSIQSEATSMDQIESHISHQCRETDSHQSSLSVHWKRSCWILHMWSQADQNEMLLLPMTSYGWCMNDGTLTVEWDT